MKNLIMGFVLLGAFPVIAGAQSQYSKDFESCRNLVPGFRSDSLASYRNHFREHPQALEWNLRVGYLNLGAEALGRATLGMLSIRS